LGAIDRANPDAPVARAYYAGRIAVSQRFATTGCERMLASIEESRAS